MTSAVSDESVAGDSGVYEPSERKYEQLFFKLASTFVTCLRVKSLIVTTVCVCARPGLPADLLLGSHEGHLATGCPQVQLGFRHESRDERFTIYVMQLSNCSAPCLLADQRL